MPNNPTDDAAALNGSPRAFYEQYLTTLSETYSDGDTFPLAPFFSDNCTLISWGMDAEARGRRAIIAHYEEAVQRMKQQVQGLHRIEVQTDSYEDHVSEDGLSAWAAGCQTVLYRGRLEARPAVVLFTHLLSRPATGAPWKFTRRHTSQAGHEAGRFVL